MKLSINSILDSIRRGIVTAADKPIEIRDETIIDKLIVNEDDDYETDLLLHGWPNVSDSKLRRDYIALRKKLLWPPLYHNKDCLSFFYYPKNEYNRNVFIKLHGGCPDDYFKLDQWCHSTAIFRMFSRLFRFLFWLVLIPISFLGYILGLNTYNKSAKRIIPTGNKWYSKIYNYIIAHHLDLSRSSKVNFSILSLAAVFCIYMMVDLLVFFIHDIVLFQPTIGTTYRGSVMITQPCGVEQYFFVQSSAALWNDSGIDLCAGDEIEVTYSGSFNTTLRDVYQSTISHKPPTYPLKNVKSARDIDSALNNFLIYNDSTHRMVGALLIQITPSSMFPENRLSTERSNIMQLNSECGKFKYKVPKPGILNIAVNDFFISKDIFDSILLTPDINKHLKQELLNYALYPKTVDMIYNKEDLTRQLNTIKTDIFNKLIFCSLSNLDKLSFVDNVQNENIEVDNKKQLKWNPSNDKNAILQLRNVIANIETQKNRHLNALLNSNLDNCGRAFYELLPWNAEKLWYNDNYGNIMVCVKVTRKLDGFSNIKRNVFRWIDNKLT